MYNQQRAVNDKPVRVRKSEVSYLFFFLGETVECMRPSPSFLFTLTLAVACPTPYPSHPHKTMTSDLIRHTKLISRYGTVVTCKIRPGPYLKRIPEASQSAPLAYTRAGQPGPCSKENLNRYVWSTTVE